MPSRLLPVTRAVSACSFPSVRVAHAELVQRLWRAALPLGDERVADVTQVLHAQLAREEARGREVPEAVEEGDAGGMPERGLLGPRDVVQQGGPLGITRCDEGLAPAIVA